MVHDINAVDLAEIPRDAPFLVDTNVLCRIHLGEPCTDWPEEKVNDYSNFIGGLLLRGNRLLVSLFNLQEIFHTVERMEFNKNRKLYKDKKVFRNTPAERQALQTKLRGIIAQIKSSYFLLEDTISSGDTDSFLSSYCTHTYDPIDYLVVEHNCSSCVNFITDDTDFRPDSRLNVYAYNP